MVRSPLTLEAFLAEVESAAGADRHLDASLAKLRKELADVEDRESRARRVVEHMALVLQASLLMRYSPPQLADAFCAARLGGKGGHEYGTLTPGADFAAVIARHAPSLAS